MAERAPRRIGDLIPAWLAHAKECARPLEEIRRRWPGLVGKAMARHARPVSLRRGRLYVSVDEPGAGFVLRLEGPRLVKQLRSAPGCDVEEIVTRAGG